MYESSQNSFMFDTDIPTNGTVGKTWSSVSTRLGTEVHRPREERRVPGKGPSRGSEGEKRGKDDREAESKVSGVGRRSGAEKKEGHGRPRTDKGDEIRGGEV